MKLQADLSPIVPKEPSRYSTPYSWTEVWDDQHVNIATDGRIAAIVPVKAWGESDTDGPLPVEATKAAFKLPKNQRGRVDANGSLRVGSTTFDRPDNTTTPQVRECVPKLAVDTCSLTIDVELLYRLAKVLGEAKESSGGVNGPKLALTLVAAVERTENGAVRIDNSLPVVVRNANEKTDIRNGAQPFGIIMPMSPDQAP